MFITFKSYQENFKKEFLGLKRNTIRKFEDNDIRKEVLDMWINNETTQITIEIINKANPQESFKREVTDVSFWDGYYVISW